MEGRNPSIVRPRQSDGRLLPIHGHSIGQPTKSGQSKTYSCWSSMLARCRRRSDPRFSDYGGRGISVCDRWLSFPNFLADMGEKPEGMSIERIDNDGDYCPDNCKWATRLEQQANTRLTRNLTYQGKTQSVSAWSRELNIDQATLSHRLNIFHWSIDEALSIRPVRGGHHNRSNNEKAI